MDYPIDTQAILDALQTSRAEFHEFRDETRRAHVGINERIGRLEERVNRMALLLVGPDDSPERGIPYRLKALENDHEKMTKRTDHAYFAAITAVIGGLGALIVKGLQMMFGGSLGHGP